MNFIIFSLSCTFNLPATPQVNLLLLLKAYKKCQSVSKWTEINANNSENFLFLYKSRFLFGINIFASFIYSFAFWSLFIFWLKLSKMSDRIWQYEFELICIRWTIYSFVQYFDCDFHILQFLMNLVFVERGLCTYFGKFMVLKLVFEC